MTDAEVILWTHLRRRNINGLRFRRQHQIGPYIADFACLSLNLIIEVDGPSHQLDNAFAYDERRRLHLNKLGWREIRIANMDMYKNLDRVLQHIWQSTEDPPSGAAADAAHPLPP